MANSLRLALFLPVLVVAACSSGGGGGTTTGTSGGTTGGGCAASGASCSGNSACCSNVCTSGACSETAYCLNNGTASTTLKGLAGSCNTGQSGMFDAITCDAEVMSCSSSDLSGLASASSGYETCVSALPMCTSSNTHNFITAAQACQNGEAGGAEDAGVSQGCLSALSL